MNNVQKKIDVETWKDLCEKKHGTNFMIPKITHRDGKIVASIQRCENDLLLHTAFLPNTNSRDIAALLTSVSLILNIPKKVGENSFHVVAVKDKMTSIVLGEEKHDAAVRDKITDIVQGGCLTLLISDLPWDEFNRNESPTIAISFDDTMCSWMGMRPIKSAMDNRFCIDWCGISEAQQIWRNIVANSLGTWWLWLPPLEVHDQVSTSKAEINQPFLVVAYLYNHQGKSEFFLRAALHPTTSHEFESKFEVVEIKIRFQLKTGSLDKSFKKEVKNRCLSHNVNPMKYPKLLEFSLECELKELDDKTIPVVQITLAKKQ